MFTTKKLGLTALAITAFGAIASTSALAMFTDSAAVGANVFSSGSVNISTNPTTALVTFSGMMPGDSVTNSLVVTNSATSQFRYAISSTATNVDALALKDNLDLVIKTVDVTTPLTPCDNFDGTQLYAGDLDSTSGLLVGNAAQGTHAGDRVLAGGANEALCFRVSFDAAKTGPQAASTTATFTFSAEQTQSNP